MKNQKLKDLEKKHVYVFHGSEHTVEEFEPRQAYTIVDGRSIPDGEPAIFASPFSDYAIFKSIVNKTNCPKGFRSGCSYKNDQLEFTATEETLSQLSSNSRGFVYVFNRSDFQERSPSEWVCYKKVKPVEVIKVQWSDFTVPIRKIENDTIR